MSDDDEGDIGPARQRRLAPDGLALPPSASADLGEEDPFSLDFPPWLPLTSSSSATSHEGDGLGSWAEAPADVLRLVVARLPLHDVQSTLLVCREWHSAFADGLASLRPRLLRVDRLAARFPSLQRLDLAACSGRLGDADAAALGSCGPLRKSLRALSLAGAEDLTDAGVASLASGLTALTSLSLANCCRVGDGGAAALSGLLLPESVGGGGAAAAAAWRRSWSSSNGSSGSQNALSSANYPPLPSVLRGVPSLRDLDVSGCVALTERGFSSLAKGLTALTALKLGGCSRVATVTDGCVRALASSEHLSASLQRLDLAGCLELTDSGLEAACSSFENLRSLSLWNCLRLTDAGLAALHRQSQSRGEERSGGSSSPSRLTELSLRGLSQLSDAALVHVSALPSLSSLDLRACERITGERLALLAGNSVSGGGGGEENGETASGDDSAAARFARHSHHHGSSSSRRLRHLTCLNLKGCYKVAAPGLAALGALTSLRCLSLRECWQVTRDGLASLSGLRHLTELDLQGCRNISNEVGQPLPSLAKMGKLVTLSLKGCDGLRDGALEALREGGGSGGAAAADIEEEEEATTAAAASGASLAPAAASSSAAAADEGEEAGASAPFFDPVAAPRPPPPSPLSANNGDGPGTPLLRCLDLSGCHRLTGEGLSPVRSLGALTCLKLAHCRGLRAGADLAPLAGLTSLAALSLSGCSNLVEGAGVASLAPLTALRALSLDGCRNALAIDAGLAALAPSLPGVSSLNLQGCATLTDAGIAAMGRAGASLRSLAAISVQDCALVTGVGFGSWSPSSTPMLTSICLQNCASLSDEGLRALAGAVAPIRSLNLKGCRGIGDDGLAALPRRLTRLHHLRLQGNQRVTDAGLAALAAIPSLRALELPNCWRVTDEGVSSLTKLTALAHLDISYCWKVTDEGVAALAERGSLVRLSITGCHRLTPRGRASVRNLLEYPALNY